MTTFKDIIKLYKEVSIDTVTSLNIYENSSILSTLVVFSNGTFKKWLTLKLSTIKNSGLGFFSAHSQFHEKQI
jgi:hypothetical protein